MPLFLLLLFLLTSCAGSPPSAPGSPSRAAVLPVEEEFAQLARPDPDLASLSDPQTQPVTTMDRFLSGRMSKEEARDERKKCLKSKKNNPFCYTWIHYTQLRRLIGLRNRTPIFPAPKVVTPVVLEWDGDKLKNQNKVRKEKVPNLLKGMTGWTSDQVSLLANLSLKEKHCPNNLAIVAAASMEDYLPNGVKPDDIARLYEYGGRCSRRHSPDFDNFFTRAGLLYLYEGDTPLAIKALSRVRPRDATSGRVLYWRYRAYLAANDPKRAKKALDELLAHYRFSFHALIARESARENSPSAFQKFLDPRPILAKQSRRVKRVNDLINQINLLRQGGFSSSASILAEWTLAQFRRAEPEVKAYVASLAEAQVGVLIVPDLVSRHAKLLGKDTMQLLYPRPFAEAFEKQKDIIDPFLLWAVARKESRFDANAVSPANAQGLLQLQPQTAQRVLGRTQVDLLDPQVNAEASARYLAELLKLSNGQIPLALAMYNAGEDSVQTWKSRFATSDPILLIDLIPFRETRDYVGSVLSNYFWYRKLYLADGQTSRPGESDPFQDLINPNSGQVPPGQPAEKHSFLSPLGAFHRPLARRNGFLLTPN